MFSICAFQVFLVPFQWINFATRKADPTRVRFFILTNAFFVFNLTWIFLLKSFSFDTWKEIPIIGYLGILTIGYSYYYISRESGINKSKTNAIRLVLFLSVVYVLQQILKVNLSADLMAHLAIVTIILTQVIAVFFGAKLIHAIVETRIKTDYLSPIYSATLITACIYCFSPLLFGLVNESSIEFVLINSPFLIISLAYIVHHIKQLKTETNLLNSHLASETLNGRYGRDEKRIKHAISIYHGLNMQERNDRIASLFAEYDLTERQIEIAILIINGTSTKQIAGLLEIKYATVRVHIMTISIKTGVDGVKEFREKFQTKDK